MFLLVSLTKLIHFWTMFQFMHPESLWFYNIFREYKIETLDRNRQEIFLFVYF